MTNLIERFSYVWEIDHDKTPEVSTVYGGPFDAGAALETTMAFVMSFPPAYRANRKIDYGNGITLTYEHTGLEEVPEETGGDN
jgi:hypothetical protein